MQKVIMEKRETYLRTHTDNPYIVYGLVDPISLEIRYVGKTVQGMKRIREHLKPSSLKEGNTKKNNWLKSLLNQGLKPLFVIIATWNNDKSKEFNNDVLYSLEQYCIHYMKIRTDDYLLKNDCDGGKGAVGRVISEETRKKMSESAKRRGLPQALIDQQKRKKESICQR